MYPKPLSQLNHFTVPVATCDPSFLPPSGPDLRPSRRPACSRMRDCFVARYRDALPSPRRLAANARRGQAPRAGPSSGAFVDLVDLDRAANALEADLVDDRALHEVIDLAERALGDEDLPRRRAVGEPRGEVHVVAEHRVVA